jgi:transposase-like protein
MPISFSPSVEHRQHHYLNNCAENSYQPTRQREQLALGTESSAMTWQQSWLATL